MKQYKNSIINLFFHISYFIFHSLFLTSCHSNKSEKTDVSENKSQSQNIPTGQVLKKVFCNSDASQNYSLYLPKNYSMGVKTKCIK